MKLFATVCFLTFISTSVLASPLSEQELQGWLHQTGFSVTPSKIDGPDYFGHEPVFKAAYEKLKSRYGNDYLPDSLPKELHSIRQRVHDYIVRRADGSITGGKIVNFRLAKGYKQTYRAGAGGINNGAGFDYRTVNGLADKITRLSFCFGISPRILVAQIEKESEFVGSAISSSGAVGFMQITNTSAVEVSEQLGFGSKYRKANHNPKGRKIYEEYINCFLKGSKKWTPPWSVRYLKSNTVDHIVNQNYQTAIRNSKRGREFTFPYSSRVDRWLNGELPGSSHDNGLIYGAVYLKFLVGHNGITKGLQEFNNDTVKVSYSRTIRQRAETVDFKFLRFNLFGKEFNLLDDGSESFIDSLEVMTDASEAWKDSTVEAQDTYILRELRSLELPGHHRLDDPIEI